MRSGQEEIKSPIQAHTESQVEEMKIPVFGYIGKIEEEVQCVKLKIGKVESEVQRKIEESNCEVQEKIGNLERRVSELEERPNYFPASPEFISSRPTANPLTFDVQTSWTVFKAQFDVVNYTNGWTDFEKVSQLVASLRGSAAKVLQGIPADKLTDLTTIEKALESRFGDSQLTQFYKTKNKNTEARRKPSRIDCRCGTANEHGLRRVPSGCSAKLSSLVLRRRHQRRRHATFNQTDGRKRSEIIPGL
ncbi:hypothetical protein AVEN_133816-1 [Araneus ventricosus]|uniref:Uncharacterized protein n=1 Tax=Araneus ventricosus TaxID=182803 RepID=A0A4Y2QZI0_ARAVE|nr:hypothetical protein AVEN_133816-1 [Araneus ventricosus]